MLYLSRGKTTEPVQGSAVGPIHKSQLLRASSITRKEAVVGHMRVQEGKIMGVEDDDAADENSEEDRYVTSPQILPLSSPC